HGMPRCSSAARLGPAASRSSSRSSRRSDERWGVRRRSGGMNATLPSGWSAASAAPPRTRAESGGSLVGRGGARAPADPGAGISQRLEAPLELLETARARGADRSHRHAELTRDLEVVRRGIEVVERLEQIAAAPRETRKGEAHHHLFLERLELRARRES